MSYRREDVCLNLPPVEDFSSVNLKDPESVKRLVCNLIDGLTGNYEVSEISSIPQLLMQSVLALTEFREVKADGFEIKIKFRLK